MFQTYVDLIILGICLCTGFVLKKWVKDVENKYIPTINAALGLLLSFWLCGWPPTPEEILRGMISGLSATGAYEAFRQFLETGGAAQ